MVYRLPLDQDDVEEELDKTVAPFTADQVEALAKWQRWGTGAKAKCPTHRDSDPMTVSTDGFRCTVQGCAHTQDWAYAFVLPVKYCTKDAPLALPGDPKNYVIHVDAIETDPDYDGEIISLHCPNCGSDFDVDCR